MSRDQILDVMDELRADPTRADFEDATGIYVRAKRGEKWDSVDIGELDSDSLWSWLHSRGNAALPANVVMMLLQHEQRPA